MTVDMLREYAKRPMFQSFTIHMNDGSRFKISEPDGLVVPVTWKMNAIVLLGGDRFTILYVKSISHVSSRGVWPKGGKSRSRTDRDDM